VFTVTFRNFPAISQNPVHELCLETWTLAVSIEARTHISGVRLVVRSERPSPLGNWGPK